MKQALYFLISLAYIGNLCSGLCQSGYSQQENGECSLSQTTIDNCVFFNSTFTESLYPPTLVSLHLGSTDTLTLAVSQPFVTNRIVESIRLSNNASCNYPGPFWSKGVDLSDCTDRYIAGIPWGIAYNPSDVDQMIYACGLVKDDSDPQRLYFYGTMNVTYVDILPQLDEERPIFFNRTMQEELRFQISFPKQMTVSTNVIEFSRARLLSVVTSQVYVPSPSTLQISLFTTVQSPFRLTSAYNSTTPARLSLVGPSLSQDCPTSGQLCSQMWQLVVSRQLDKCDFSGSYTFLFEVECHENATECPLLSPEYHSVNLLLTTGDVCGTVENGTSVRAQLNSYASYDDTAETFLGSRTNFFIDEPISYRLSIESDGLSLSGSVVDSVVATNNQGTPVSLASGGEISHPISLQVTRVSTTSKQHIYHLRLQYDVSWFGRLAADGSTASSITVTLSLNFQSQKRTLQIRVANENSVKAMTQVLLQEKSLEPSAESSSSTVSISSCFVILSILIAVL